MYRMDTYLVEKCTTTNKKNDTSHQHRNTTSQNTHNKHFKDITIANIYIITTDTDITNCIQYIANIPNSIITGDARQISGRNT